MSCHTCLYTPRNRNVQGPMGPTWGYTSGLGHTLYGCTSHSANKYSYTCTSNLRRLQDRSQPWPSGQGYGPGTLFLRPGFHPCSCQLFFWQTQWQPFFWQPFFWQPFFGSPFFGSPFFGSPFFGSPFCNRNNSATK